MHKKWLMTSTLLTAGLLTGCASVVKASPFAGPALLTCATDNDCRAGVYVSVGNKGECVVQLLVEDIAVGNGKHPKVVWHLEKADAATDGFEYRFDSTVGIRIIGNDPTRDFEDPRPEGDLTYKTRSVNLRASSFKYQVQVQRRVDHHADWLPCTLLDPRISNE